MGGDRNSKSLKGDSEYFDGGKGGEYSGRKGEGNDKGKAYPPGERDPLEEAESTLISLERIFK
ncbi:hypothetical protein TDIS_1233 [Thermosulfurimonas dismutans]|uniref:Uncharacterized protein n=1 Tax=Thermosulfurimonas dismutans TaxID=999894 RepID=A0A179D4T2_9BACT|nr:hypothetical protein TDIS_1233 [Thermosulfurimonas dismutans]